MNEDCGNKVFFVDNGVRNTGYSLGIIEIVGRNHAPEFPNCTLYNSSARAPENTNNAFVIKVCVFRIVAVMALDLQRK